MLTIVEAVLLLMCGAGIAVSGSEAVKYLRGMERAGKPRSTADAPPVAAEPMVGPLLATESTLTLTFPTLPGRADGSEAQEGDVFVVRSERMVAERPVTWGLNSGDEDF